ncbi:class D beta-lactamase [Rhabdochromatium marinum]|uniref:class D beta-lactamase n=1 Tax=Rhabdochromatium marinum TaxID=48729 RepID=UPI001908F65C|nr:class D beta-lactamase [Rhabdochromatium marinum]MBK1648575.1 class D beta-lactamase [Rhabdochromatium marinum]
MRLPLFSILFCAILSAASNAVAAEDSRIAELFAQAGVEGTLIIEAVTSGERMVHNQGRATQPFIAASTFKVLNTLIAVENGVIADPEAPIPWDGTEYAIPAWNQDQTLRSAFQVSCVWCYQQLARRIGTQTYRDIIQQIGYGQLHVPFAVDTFWLDGALTISAAGQVAFLKQLVTRRLPFQPSTYDALEAVMRSSEAPGARLYAKTGWSTRRTPGVGWYIGYLQRPDETWVFALNLDTRDAQDLPLRQQLVLEALHAKGLLPATQTPADVIPP